MHIHAQPPIFLDMVVQNYPEFTLFYFILGSELKL